MDEPTEESEDLGFIGRYRLLHKLGEGGMGIVWLAQHPELSIEVAIKTMKSNDPEDVQRFLQEARSAELINHYRVAQVYDSGSDGDLHYIAMEFLPGGDIGDLMGDAPMDPVLALYIVEGVAQGLSAAGKVGIIHRDIKPDNIMLDHQGEPKLVDLGLAKELTSDSSITVTGTLMGTPAYIAPEQAMAKSEIDTRADIYSLGATLFHLVTGGYPFEAASPIAMALAHCNEATPNPQERNPDIPDSLSRLILKMMEKEPEDRYQNPEELLSAIKDVFASFGDGQGQQTTIHEAKQVILKPSSRPKLVKKKKKRF